MCSDAIDLRLHRFEMRSAAIELRLGPFEMRSGAIDLRLVRFSGRFDWVGRTEGDVAM